MQSVASPDRLEAALAAAIRRFDGSPPLTSHVHHHFALDDGAAPRGTWLRMQMVVAVALEEGGDVADALDPACAVEIVHNYSLVHDDIQNGDALRHGRESVWARYGIAQGINTGDAMCAIAYLQLLTSKSTRPAERSLAMTRVLHEAHFALCSGQARDIAFGQAAIVDHATYLTMVEGKTAALFGAACELGALAAGTALERARGYGQLGRTYGVAFQIEDDVLGIWGDLAAVGKPLGADVAKRKWTFPIVWALAGGPSAARTMIAERYARGRSLDVDDVQAVVAALDALGARDAALQAARTMLDRADTIAREADLDRNERVRALFGRAISRVA